MENWIINNLGAWSYFLIPIVTGIITSFWTEGIHLSLQLLEIKKNPKWLVLIISLIIALLLMMILDSLYTGPFEFILAYCTNVLVAIGFYVKLGPYTVDRIFKNIKTKIDIKTKLK